MAAVLGWRLPEPAPTDPGPFPWLSGIPAELHDHPVWREYLAKRSQLVTGLADHVRRHAAQDGTQPVWAPPGSHPNAAIIGDVALWRAVNGIDPRDRRPTGPGQLQLRPPSGNNTSTEVSPTQATTRRASTREGARLPRASPKTATGKTDITRGDPRSVQRRCRRGHADRRATGGRWRVTLLSGSGGRQRLGYSPGDYFRPAR